MELATLAKIATSLQVTLVLVVEIGYMYGMYRKLQQFSVYWERACRMVVR